MTVQGPSPADTTDRAAALGDLRARIRALTDGETDEIALMATVACELYRGIPGYDWVGFYRVTGPQMLRIGPYQGGHGCLAIPFSRGVCGAAARAEATLIVPDVEAFSDHIACAASTRSEIVLPVFDAAGRMIAVLDIDSDTPDHFGEADREALEAMLAEVFGRLGMIEEQPAPVQPPGLPQRRRLAARLRERLSFEDDVFYGPVLLLAHLAIAGLAWPMEWFLAERSNVTTAELLLCSFIATAMMIPVGLILRAYYQGKLSPALAVSYMITHAGLIVVGYAGIFGMLEYGPPGGLEGITVQDDTCRPSWSTDFYLSMITFTTLGYGDCTPYGWARLFAGIEALLSYVFVGIVIGLLTGIAPVRRDP